MIPLLTNYKIVMTKPYYLRVNLKVGIYIWLRKYPIPNIIYLCKMILTHKVILNGFIFVFKILERVIL